MLETRNFVNFPLPVNRLSVPSVLSATLSRVLHAALLLLLLVSATAEARDRSGAIAGVVLDELTGDALAGVRITVVAPGSEERLNATTNDQGRFQVTLPDGRDEYLFRLEKEDYETFLVNLTGERGKVVEQTFRIMPLAGPQAVQQEAARIYNEGADAYNAGDLEAAQAKLTEALELDPTLEGAWLGLARIYMAQQDYTGIKVATDKLIEANAADAGVWQLRFAAGLGLDDADLLQSAREKIAPEHHATLAIDAYNDGVHASQTGDNDRAIRRFQLAVELDPERAEAFTGLTTLYYNRQEFAQAAEAARRLLELDPGNQHGLKVRYLALDALNDPEAPAAFQAYQQGNPTSAVEELVDRADELFRRGAAGEAKKLAQQILDTDANHVRGNFLMAMCLLNGGETAKAKTYFQKVVELAPDSPSADEAREMLSYL